MGESIYALFDSVPVAFVPDYLPTSGRCYLYVWDDDTHKDDWKADGYRWRQGGGQKNQKCGEGKLLNKTYFQAYDGPKSWTTSFQRTAYYRLDKPKAVLIQYSGDEKLARQFPHGNSKKDQRNFVRIQPHVLNEIQSSTSSAMRVYQELVTNPSGNHPITSKPRNVEQVRNTKKGQRNKGRLSHDALFNLHEFAMDSDFVQHITTFPDLSIIAYHPSIIEYFRSFISDEDSPTQQMTYDTTFNLGDFYVSVLFFRATDFESNPVIPLGYFLHERKLESTHDEFFRHMKKICPEINTTSRVVMITDQERAIQQAITEHFPNLKMFLCWNHLIQDSKRWLRSHGVSDNSEMKFYVDNIRDLLNSTSIEHYKDKLLVSLPKWSHPFSEYFMGNIHPSIDRLGLWELAPLGLDQATTNQSESFNYVLKRLQEWKEAPVDGMVLSLHRISQYHIAEIRRGLCGLGNFVLRSGKTVLPTSSLSPDSVVQPEEIVALIRNGQQSSTNDEPVPSTSNHQDR